MPSHGINPSRQKATTDNFWVLSASSRMVANAFMLFILAQSLAMLLFHDKWFCSIVDADFYVVAASEIIRLHIKLSWLPEFSADLLDSNVSNNSASVCLVKPVRYLA
jgi:hypothetical protein